LVLCF